MIVFHEIKAKSASVANQEGKLSNRDRESGNKSTEACGQLDNPLSDSVALMSRTYVINVNEEYLTDWKTRMKL